jgi:hypothetical protein
MSALSTLYTQIGIRINDPVTNSPATGDGDEVLASQKLTWINEVIRDTAMLTDCIQKSSTVTGTGSAETYDISSKPTANATFWRMLSVSDQTNGIIYLPVKRRDYQAAYKSIVTNSVAGEFIYSDFLKADSRLYILPIVSNAVAITIEFSELPAILGDGDALPGIFNDYDSLIVAGVARLYFEAAGDEVRSQQIFSEYIDWVQRLAKEIGVNPEILPEMSSLYRFIGSKMKELSGA